MASPTLTEDCPTCGEVISDSYCPACGERRPSSRIYSLREFAHEAFEVVTNVERSFLRTLWTLIRRPGELTAAYMRGERARYLRPLQLFVAINVAFFFASGPGTGMYTTPLYSHLHSSPYKAHAAEVVADQRARSGMTEAEYEAAFNAKARVLARTLVLVIAPAFALCVAVMSLRRRRRAVQHLVFGLHWVSFMLLLTTGMATSLKFAAVPVWRALGGPLSDWGVDQVAGIVMAIGIVAYLYPAFRRAYGDGKLAAAIKAVVSVAAIVTVLTLYRMLLFYVTAFTL